MTRENLEHKSKTELVALAKANGLEADGLTKAELLDLLSDHVLVPPAASETGEPVALSVFLESERLPVGIQGVLLAFHKHAKHSLEDWSALVRDLYGREV